MKKTFKLFILGLSIVLITSSTWYVLQKISCSCQPKSAQTYAPANWTKTLGLTQEQQLSINKIEQEYVSKSKQASIQLSQIRLLLCDNLRKEIMEKADIDKYIHQLAQAQAEEERATIINIMKIQETLTPAQKKIFFETIMKDICSCCRNETGSDDCQCGLCKMDPKSRRNIQ
ncbi:MAG: hypothetical protein ABII23_01790 [bacterium]